MNKIKETKNQAKFVAQSFLDFDPSVNLSSQYCTMMVRSSIPTLLLMNHWPRPLADDMIDSTTALPQAHDEIRAQVEETGDLLIRVVTWNQEAKEPPTPETLVKHLFPECMYHIIVVGTQECENTFAKSIIFPTKEKWESTLHIALGPEYDPIRSHSLQASHIIAFAHKSVLPLISNVRSHAVPTGIAETMGNKGGVGISMSIGDSTFAFLNAHLAAHHHQRATEHRVREFRKISKGMATNLSQQKDGNNIGSSNSTGSSSNYFDCATDVLATDHNNIDEEVLLDDGEIISSGPYSQYHHHHHHNDDHRTDAGPLLNPLVELFNFVFWFGDLNFRINGTREVVDGMLENHMHDALLCNDELTMLLRFNRIFAGFAEGPLNFFPTYKFDYMSDHYDSSHKRRVPSWTDRIIFKSDANIQLLSYCSAPSIRSSDHRPVYATFSCRINVDNNQKHEIPSAAIGERTGSSWETKNEGCCVQ